MASSPKCSGCFCFMWEINWWSHTEWGNVMCNSNTHLVIIQTFLAQIIYLMGIERAIQNRKRWSEWREIIKSHSKEEEKRRLLKLYPLNTLEDHCFNTKKVHAYCYSVMSRCIRLMIEYSPVLNVKLCIIVCALWVHVGSYAHNNIG